MVVCSNHQDEKEMNKMLKKHQPFFYKKIEEIKFDPRCAEAHRFCVLYCASALGYAGRGSYDSYEPFSEEQISTNMYLLAQKDSRLNKRGLAYPGKLQRHVLNGLGFDDEDSDWLKWMISSFLILIEENKSDDS